MFPMDEDDEVELVPESNQNSNNNYKWIATLNAIIKNTFLTKMLMIKLNQPPGPMLMQK